MRRVHTMLGVLLSMTLGVTGCSGSDDGDDGGPTDPGGGGGSGTTVTLSTAEKNTVSAGLNGLATRIGATDADARRFVNALAFLVQTATTATDVDVTTTLNVLDGGSPTSAASFSASAAMVTRRVLGYSVSVRTDAPGQRTYRGAIVWDQGGSKIIVTVLGNPNILNVTLPSVGNAAYLAGSQTQIWGATSGTVAWTLINGGSVECPRPLPNVLSACGYEDGTVPFTISESVAVPFSGNTASGSRTAALGNTRVRVLFINIICGVAGGPC